MTLATLPSRAATIDAFLATTDWAQARRTPLAGDASARRYERLSGGPTPALLMDADPARGEDVAPFVAIAAHLRTHGLHAPQVHAADAEAGLLVIEDLGEGLFARLADDPEVEIGLYSAATDVLVALRELPPPPGLARYGPAEMAASVDLVSEWYAPGTPPLRPIAEAGLAALPAMAEVTILRDFHAENLIWRPDAQGLARVGLIDFQDAVVGSPAYDIASLLTDARRDVRPAARATVLARYLAATGDDPHVLERAVAVQGAKRNLRILGVFARLCLRDGKPGYVDLMPRVWAHLQCDLAHPALVDLRAAVAAHLPAPDAAFRADLKSRCPAPA
ncbi:MAG: aminoglycoside phosphotransferase family protein [Shimia sp.]